MTKANAMTALYRANGKTIEISGESFEIKNTRVTYGAGVCLTLDRPLPGRTSRLLTVDNNSPDIAINLAKALSS